MAAVSLCMGMAVFVAHSDAAGGQATGAARFPKNAAEF
jgi:hypothetical protein